MKNKVIKKTVYDKIKTNVNNLKRKIPDTTTLNHINQYNTDKKNLEKEIEGIDKKILDVSSLVTTTVLDTNKI